MRREVKEYLDYLTAINSSSKRINGMRYCIDKLIVYLQEQGITKWGIAGEKELSGFSEWLKTDYRERNSKEISGHSLQRWVSCMKVFYRWLKTSGRILHNPAEQISLPKTDHIKPKVLTEQEIAKLIEEPDTTKPIGIRDRAIMEMLYGTGIRMGELQKLEVYDISLKDKEVMINESKNNRGRLLPMTESVYYWLEKYLKESRPELIKGFPLQKKRPHSNGLWISRQGTKLGQGTIEQQIKYYARKLGIKATAHTFRHSFATHLLRSGAHIEEIRQLLGHRDIYSTQLYTHLTVSDLKRVIDQADKEID